MEHRSRLRHRSRLALAATTITTLAATMITTATPAVAATTDPVTQEVVDPDATAQTLSLQTYLEQVGQSDAFMFGHQNDLTQSVSDSPNGDVFDATGSYPAIAGLGVEQDVDGMIASIQAAYERGIITTVEDHMPNFSTGGAYNDISTTVEYILPGGKDNAAFLEHLDQIAAWANGAVDENGDAIPIIFRPFHENNGSWFWWGATNTTTSEYIALWRYTVEYLRDVKGVHNFLYAYSPNGHFTSAEDYLTRWPGDEYVDIVGFDTYYDNPVSPSDSWWDAFLTDARIVTAIAESKGKVAAATEVGLRYNGSDGLAIEGNAVPDWYTRVADLLSGDDAVDLAYLMTWRNQSFNLSESEGYSLHFWTPYVGFTTNAGTVYPDHEMLGDFRDFVARDAVMMAQDIGDAYGQDVVATEHGQSAYLMSPRRSNTQTYDGVATLAAKAFGDVATVVFDADGTTVTGSYNATTGYWEAAWDTSTSTPGTTVLVTMTVTFTDGEVITDSDTPTISGAAGGDPGLLDDFESYGSSEALAERWQRNVNGGVSTVTLVDSPTGEGAAMQWDFDATGPGYTGIERSVEALDWTIAGDPVTFAYQASVPDPGATFQVTSSAGTYAVALSSVPGFDPASTDLQQVSIPLDLLAGLSWSNPATPTLSGEVTTISFYSGSAGSTVLDTIRLGDAPVVEIPTVIDDF